MVLKDDSERLRDTLAYIDALSGISPAHAAHLRLARGADLAASRRISLGGFHLGARDAADTRRRRALRALLLCLDWSGLASEIPMAKSTYANASSEDIDDAVRSFFPLLDVSEATVLATARRVQPEIGSGHYEQWHPLRRGAVLAGTTPMHGNCYSAVATWLYVSGAVSLRWIMHYGSQPGLALPTWASWGADITTPVQASIVPAGRVCRLEKPAAIGGGLHYVLTIRPGVCVGVNNSADVVVERWIIARYPVRPRVSYCEFPLAGYLAAMEPGSKIRTASCMPTLYF